MRVEIVQELEPDDDKLEIPWASPENPQLRYYDLKARPELIGSLEEVQKCPVLEAVLRLVNGPDSAFRTAKCDVWSTTELSAEELCEVGPAQKVGSYLDVVFDLPGFNFAVEHYVRLGEKLELILRPVPVQAQIEVAIRHCLFHPEERWGFYCTLFVHAYGSTADRTQQAWNQAIGALAAALGQISKALRATLRSSRP